MKINAYSIYDRKTLAYFPPFYAPTHAAAVRSVTDLVSDTNNNVGRHPNDFVLYCVGAFDDSRGGLEPAAPIEHIVDVSALVQALAQELPFPVNVTNGKDNDGAKEVN